MNENVISWQLSSGYNYVTCINMLWCPNVNQALTRQVVYPEGNPGLKCHNSCKNHCRELLLFLIAKEDFPRILFEVRIDLFAGHC